MCFEQDQRLINIQIDTHNWKKNKQIDHLFITHSHGDHIKGLKTLLNKFEPYVYASHITVHILQQIKNIIPEDYSKIRKITDTDLHEYISLSGSEFKMKSFDACHSPGSLMFMFDTINNGKILYTGDCHGDILKNHEFKCSLKNVCKLYYDNTFKKEIYKKDLPNSSSSIIMFNEIFNRNKRNNKITYLDVTVMGSECLVMELMKMDIKVVMCKEIPSPRLREITYVLSLDQKIIETSVKRDPSTIVLITGFKKNVEKFSDGVVVRLGCYGSHSSANYKRIPWCRHISKSDMQELFNLCDHDTITQTCNF